MGGAPNWLPSSPARPQMTVCPGTRPWPPLDISFLICQTPMLTSSLYLTQRFSSMMRWDDRWESSLRAKSSLVTPSKYKVLLFQILYTGGKRFASTALPNCGLKRKKKIQLILFSPEVSKCEIRSDPIRWTFSLFWKQHSHPAVRLQHLNFYHLCKSLPI